MQGLYTMWSVYLGYGVLLVCHIFDLILDDFSLLFSMASIELSESVYITHLTSSFFCISLIAIFLLSFQLCGCMLLLLMSANTAKPNLFPVLFGTIFFLVKFEVHHLLISLANALKYGIKFFSTLKFLFQDRLIFMELN